MREAEEGEAMIDSTTKSKRWFDEDDFTPQHDSIMISVMEGWKQYLSNLYGQKYGAERLNLDGKLFGEPELKGFPPVYPDAVAICDLRIGHSLELSELEVVRRDWNSYQRRALYHKAPEFPDDCKVWCKCLCGGYLDDEFICHKERKYAILEIKPKIESFGATLRQLKIYEDRKDQIRSWLDGFIIGSRIDVDIILVTKDHRYDALFAEQSILIADPAEFKKGGADMQTPLFFEPASNKGVEQNDS